MNKSTYQIHYKLHPAKLGDKRELSRPKSTKIFTLPVAPVQPTYTEAFSRKTLPKYTDNSIDYSFLEKRKVYVRTQEQVSENVKIAEFSPELLSKNERLRGAACLLGAVHLGILNGAKSTYQEDYRGLKPDRVEFENMNTALKKLAQAPDDYAMDSLQRKSYRAEQLSPLLQQSTTRYGCNKNKTIPALGALPTIKLLKKKFGLDYKRTSYQDSYKLPKLCTADNHIKGLDLHPLGTKGMGIPDNELLTRKFLNRKKTCRFGKSNKQPATMGHMDITMDRANVNDVETVM